MMAADATERLGVVVIGRNEGDRLIRCLRSIGGHGRVVYVDSGSTDGSQDAAAALGARVIALDMARPFTAARARNAGLAALPAECAAIQFVDGDCTLDPGWLEKGQAALAADPRLAAVFGRLRETAPEASIYNRLCDMEWAVAPGPARFCGGNAMIRRAALDAAGGYPEAMIAGEEPDLSIRMRALGWTIRCLPAEMMRHDAAMSRFGQYWRRATRTGHAFAELADRHRGSPLHDYGRRLASALLWGAALPAVAVAGIVAGALARSTPLLIVGVVALVAPGAQALRILLRERQRRPWRDAAALALFLMLAKPAQVIGAARYWRGRIGGRRATIIEYKDRERAA